MSLSTVIGLMAQINKATEVTSIAANIYHPTPGVDDAPQNKAGGPSPGTSSPGLTPGQAALLNPANAAASADDVGPASAWVDPAETGPDLRQNSNPMAAALASLRLPAGPQMALLAGKLSPDLSFEKNHAGPAGQPVKSGPDIAKGGTADLLLSTQSALKLAMGDIKPATQLNGLYLALKPDVPQLSDKTQTDASAADDPAPASSGLAAAKVDIPAVKFPVLAPLAADQGLDSLKAAPEPTNAATSDQTAPQPAKPSPTLLGLLQSAPAAAFSVADLQIAGDDMSSLIDAMIVNSHSGAQGKLDDLARPKPTMMKVDVGLTPGDVAVHDSPDATVIAVAVGRVETTTSPQDIDQRARMAEAASEPTDETGSTTARKAGESVSDPSLARELNSGLEQLDAIDTRGLNELSRPVMEGALGGAILNAAMIPGWPPPRPFANAMVKQFLSGDPKQAEESLLEVLKSIGIGKKLMERMREKLKEIRRKLEALINLGVLYTTVMSVMEALADELQALADEEEDEARGSFFGGRHRIADR